jgi:hypothetical protein
MMKIESWVMSAGIHGALMLGAILVGLEGTGFGIGIDSGSGFPCTRGEPTWRVDLVERPGNGFTREGPNAAEPKPVVFLMPHGPTPCVIPRESKTRAGRLRACTCSIRFLGMDRTCPIHARAAGYRRLTDRPPSFGLDFRCGNDPALREDW